MICKHCKNEIPDGSIFCNWCGERQVKERKKKDAIKVPKARQLKSGKWNIELRAEGQSITEDTEELCIAKATAIRAGFLEQKKKAPPMSLGEAVDKYIDGKSAILSPSTIRTYRGIRRNNFQKYMDKSISDNINWQQVVNEEAKVFQPKTVSTAWRLLAPALKAQGVQAPDVLLPQVPKTELPWLDYEQILTLCNSIKGDPCEIIVLLALHSLRRSEIMALTGNSFDRKAQTIIVKGAAVYDEHAKLVYKSTNKNNSSQRIIPFLIPRLAEILPPATNEKVFHFDIGTMRRKINKMCRTAGVPEVGVHGLRRSFASLAYHLGWSERQTMSVGGWNSFQTMHNIYIKLSAADLTRDVLKMRTFYE